MTDKELRRLRRDELLELLVAQSKKAEELQKELEEARAALNKRELLIQNAGSIAEAALQVNGVFEAAQAAAEQYLENIRRMSGLPAEAPPPAEAGNELEAEPVPEDADSEDAAPEDVVPEDAGPEDTVPEDTDSEDVVPEGAGPEDAVPEDADRVEECGPKEQTTLEKGRNLWEQAREKGGQWKSLLRRFRLWTGWKRN